MPRQVLIAVPGALVRYRRQGQLAGPLARRLVLGTAPGVILGAVLRVYLVPGVGVFRVLALLLGPLGCWCCAGVVADLV